MNPDMNLHNYIVLPGPDSFQANGGVSNECCVLLLQICAEALIVFKFNL